MTTRPDPPMPDPSRTQGAPTSAFHHDAAEARAMAERVLHLIADHYLGVAREPVQVRGEPAALHDLLGGAPSRDGQDFKELVARLDRVALNARARTDHPRFMAFVPGAPNWAAILGDVLAAGHNVFNGSWLASAGVTTLELVVLGWFRDWLGLPDSTAGVLLSGGSMANLTAIVCARERYFGAHDRDAVLYASAEAHSSVQRAARILGFHPDQLRILETDGEHRLRPGDLARAVARDRAEGRKPFLVVANGGATSTGSVDPLEAVAKFCAQEGLWLHVDAAYGGFATLTERGRTLLRGIERADSVTLDPHKWLYQPFECGCLLVRDGHALDDAFRVTAGYLQDIDAHAASLDQPVNMTDRGPQLTRYARAIKIWLSVHTYGIDAFARAIDRTLDLAAHAETRIRSDGRFELLTPARLGIVCFRRRFDDDDEAATEARNARLVERLMTSGTGMISSTRVDGRYALRLCILNHRSTADDVDAILDFLTQDQQEGTGAAAGPR